MCTTLNFASNVDIPFQDFQNHLQRNLVRKYNIHCTGLSTPANNGIKSIGIMLKFHGKADITLARSLFIEASELINQQINQSKELRPYFVNYPISVQNTHIALFFDSDRAHPNDIWEVYTAYNNTLKYESHMMENSPSQTIHSETYEEALAIVHNDAADIAND